MFHMSKCNSIERTLAICLVGLILWPSIGVLGQQRTTTSPNRAGGGTGVSSGTSSGTTRQYTPNGTVGDAMISVDPETHRVIVITDEETSKYVGQVITNLDRPEPQVLIKVVFLEVTHNNSSDIGIEGAFSRNLNSTTVSAISYQSVGIILRVTPFINSSGMVEMIVSPQISQLSDQSVTVSAGVSAPVIDLRSADTVVVTPDGQTVIIGGLMQNQKTQTDSKVPLLGDIPLLGNLFKRRVKANTKTELMIFLTPHVVYEPAQLASLSTTERGNAEMAPKAFSEEELNRYLDTLPEKDSARSRKTRK